MKLDSSSGEKILVAPLDWGLGHATRCIPIIHELKRLGCEVFIASEGKQAALLRREFPEDTHLPLPGYRMTYSRNGKNFGLKMLAQLPKMRKAIRLEHKWLEKKVKQLGIKGIISDNRFGLYHAEVPAAILTHQLRIPSPFGNKSGDLLQKINYHYLKNFDTCWIVDFEGDKNLAGKMSHPQSLPPLPVKYLGTLSRFTRKERIEKKYDLLALISGPEPQRSQFERLIRQQLLSLHLKTIVICGKPDQPAKEALSSNIEFVHHLDSGALEKALLQSRMVLSRSGYTTVMDMVKLQKKAIFVPTPGQTEQEYLAEYLYKKNYFLSFPQTGFQLEKALEAASAFPFLPSNFPTMDQYKKVIRDFVEGL